MNLKAGVGHLSAILTICTSQELKRPIDSYQILAALSVIPSLHPYQSSNAKVLTPFKWLFQLKPLERKQFLFSLVSFCIPPCYPNTNLHILFFLQESSVVQKYDDAIKAYKLHLSQLQARTSFTTGLHSFTDGAKYDIFKEFFPCLPSIISPLLNCIFCFVFDNSERLFSGFFFSF